MSRVCPAVFYCLNEQCKVTVDDFLSAGSQHCSLPDVKIMKISVMSELIWSLLKV